jgi:hypothetical protein
VVVQRLNLVMSSTVKKKISKPKEKKSATKSKSPSRKKVASSPSAQKLTSSPLEPSTSTDFEAGVIFNKYEIVLLNVLTVV